MASIFRAYAKSSQLTKLSFFIIKGTDDLVEQCDGSNNKKKYLYQSKSMWQQSSF